MLYLYEPQRASTDPLGVAYLTSSYAGCSPGEICACMKQATLHGWLAHLMPHGHTRGAFYTPVCASDGQTTKLPNLFNFLIQSK